MTSYEVHPRMQASQGRNSNKYDCYNATDTTNAPPEARLPNGWHQGPTGYKCLLYDDLSMAQLVAGQLSNLYHMSNPSTSRWGLLQISIAVEDATSLPWTAVRNAWTTSIYEVEEGQLTWDNSTQSVISRLLLQILRLLHHKVLQILHRLPKDYVIIIMKIPVLMISIMQNIVSFCICGSRKDRSLQIPENKCNFKARTQDRT